MSRKEEVLSFMRGYLAKYGRAPILQEIVDSVEGLNWRSSALYIISQLVQEGAVEVVKDKFYPARYIPCKRTISGQ